MINSNEKVLVSVHTPKCAGLSFGLWLLKIYGKENMYLDYADSPEAAFSMNIDPCYLLEKYRDGYPYLEHKKVVHGHFWVNKYHHLKNATRITFLRDPVERTISHYFYWLELPFMGHPLRTYFLRYNLSIEQFCQLPLIRNYYTNVFFRNVDMSVFDFIGQYNALQKEMLRLNKILGVADVAIPVINKNPNVSYNEKVREIMENKTLRNTIQNLLTDDIKFYEKHAGR